MQVSGISNPPTSLGSGGGKYTAIVDQYARTLNDSTASLDDQLAAYKDLTDLCLSTEVGVGGILYRDKRDAPDLEKANDALFKSAFAKRMNAVGSEFERRVWAIAHRNDWAEQEIKVIDSFSADDQKILMRAYYNFDGRVQGMKFDTVDDWKAYYQNAAEKINAPRAAENPAVQVTLSDRALAILANGNTSGKASTPAEQAQQLLGGRGAPVSDADVALQLLQKAAEPKDASKSSGGEKATTSVETLVDTLAKRPSDVADRSQQAHASTPARSGQNA